MKKLMLLLFPVLILTVLSGCGTRPGTVPVPDTDIEQTPAPSPTAVLSPSPAPAGTAADYFPILENVRYVYEGEGSEYAAYDVVIDYAADAKVQQRTDNGGTVIVSVIEVGDGKVTRVFAREESYFRENFLNRTGDNPQVLLMDPIEAGTSWLLADGRTRTITDTAAAVDTPSGSYTAVAVETEYEGGTNTDYYARGVGLVKTVYSGDGFEVTSTLSEIQRDAAFAQTVRFYYPNIGDGKLYYRDRELLFHTNDVTRLVLETAYKEAFSDMPGAALFENTKINSLYLNDDGMVYIDLSRDFLTEMNAGSGGESLILRALAATFGGYYGADRVVLTLDGGLYESGHIQLEQGEYLTVDTGDAVPLD